MTKVLVTGFNDYADETGNPSGAVARRLDGQSFGEVLFHGRVLPVSQKRVMGCLADAIGETEPVVLIVTGVAPGRTAPALERLAVNILDFPIPDEDGEEPVDERVVEEGPDAYLTGLPVKAVLSRWWEEGIPGYVSNTAGTFLCNQTFYLARHLVRGTPVRAGLIHIPGTPSRATARLSPPPSWPLDLVENAVRVAAVVAATHSGPDVRVSAGAFS